MSKSILSPEVMKTINDAQRGLIKFYPSPIDWRDIWIYFAMTDRFNNPIMPPRKQWDGEIDTFQGGTFNGLREQLDYLKELGVGAIWISPVAKNPIYDQHAYHGYAIQDYLTLDPRYASDLERARREPEFVEGEFRQLIDAAHERGIYIILDIVLNHMGNIFSYEGGYADLPWRDDGTYTVNWHDADGNGRPDWTTPPHDPNISQDALVWPIELQRNEFFRRKGNAFSRPGDLSEQAGDFYSLKELVTDFIDDYPGYGIYYPVRYILIAVHYYLIAKYDIDGFRIDTLKYLEPDFVRMFGTAMREYAMSIGKKNFFTFGEIYDGEEKIARFIGRNTMSGDEDIMGVDAALDFPLFFKLPGVAKAQMPPSEVIGMYERRRQVTQSVISSHGDASAYFVTFLDNHDQNTRFYYVHPNDPHRYDDQVTLVLACLFTLQGIPCLYYGTEQGLHGSSNRPEAVREALWGKENAFDRQHPFYQALKQLSQVRLEQPALRYGRQYFRPISGDGTNFGYSTYAPGVLAYSRLLADQEVVVIANTNVASGWSGEVLVDFGVNPGEFTYNLLFSNKRPILDIPAVSMSEKGAGSVQIWNLEGQVGNGPVRLIHVDLLPTEVQIWGKGL